MFGPGGIAAKYRQFKENQSAPHREVTRAEFIAACVAAGMSEGDAKFHAHINATLGSRALIGKEMLSIKCE